jgi:hypothetical protein
MKIKDNLSEGEYVSMKKSFFQIYHYFLNLRALDKEYVSCLLKWAIQLNVSEKEVVELLDSEDRPTDGLTKVDKLKNLYNLVLMIYLDDIVEDTELKIITEYAEALGFKPHIVNDLLKSIVTAPFDELSFDEVKSQIHELLEMPT